MNDLSKFEQLVKSARKEAPPSVDVAAGVLATIRVKPAKAADSVDRIAVLFAAASVLAASIVAMVAWQLVEQPMVAEMPNPFVVSIMDSQ